MQERTSPTFSPEEGVPMGVVNQQIIMLSYLVLKAGGKLSLPSGPDMITELKAAHVGQIYKHEGPDGAITLETESLGTGNESIN